MLARFCIIADAPSPHSLSCLIVCFSVCHSFLKVKKLLFFTGDGDANVSNTCISFKFDLLAIVIIQLDFINFFHFLSAYQTVCLAFEFFFFFKSVLVDSAVLVAAKLGFLSGWLGHSGSPALPPHNTLAAVRLFY